MADLNRASEVNAEVHQTIRDQYEYHPWSQEQQDAGRRVRDALITATESIIANVPPCPDRSTALRKIREARMDANSAITHNGRY